MEINLNNESINSYKTVIHSNLEPAVEEHTDTGQEFNCSACNLSFESAAKLENHKKKGHSKIQIQCLICHTLFRRRDHLRRHIQTVHCSDRLSICPVCSQDCKEEELTEHLRVCHPHETQYHCTECQYSTDNLQALVSHKKVHIFTKYVCEVCNACFKRQDHLNRHTKSLHLNQFVTCEICQQIFKRRDHLLRHMREKHGIGVRKRSY